MNKRVERVLKAIENLRLGDIAELVEAIYDAQPSVAKAIADGPQEKAAPPAVG